MVLPRLTMHRGTMRAPEDLPQRPVGRTSTGRVTVRDIDEIMDLMASRQHGVVARRQLVAAGVPPYAIDHRVRRGRLRPIHRGVYGLGRLRGSHAAEMAAVLAGGDGALLSHRSAASLWRHIPRPPSGATAEVSTPGRHVLSRPGLRMHRIRPIRDDEATSFDGIPITTRARTLLDLAMVLSAHELERALARALRDGVEEHQLRELLARYPGRAGGPLLRSLLGEENLVVTRSHAEEVFLAILRRGGLPKPETNVRIRGMEVDCLFRAARLIVEIDGFTYHSSPAAVERDHDRDQRLFLAGYDVIRFTWRQLDQQPDRVLAKVAGALARAEARRR
jgi:very-short-patch-repair endonuclease/predicted transcriptional regulator of viral defense system